MHISIKVKPNGRTSSLEQLDDGTWRATLKSSPIDGKANKELIALLAKRFDCPKSAVKIKAGATARTKLIEINTL